MSNQIFGKGPGDKPETSETMKAFSKPNTKGIDSILDEIDSVLEKNAEEFVKGFIQKGGQ